MKINGIIIIVSVIMAFGLTIGGGYVAIDNLITPQGNLFEGIALTALGILTFLFLAVASNIGNAILLFKNVYLNQLDMHQKMIEFYQDMRQKSQPQSIGDILGKLGPNPMIIEAKDTNEALSKIQDVISGALKGKMPGEKKDLKDMNRKELEEELAKAVKKDNFEKATEIRELIRNLDSGDDQEEKKDE